MSIDQNASFKGGRPTFTALPNWLRSQVTPHEGWLLWVLQSHYPNIYPSLALLAEESGMSKSMVAKLLGEFETRGMVKRHRSFRKDGRSANTEYELTIWDIDGPIAQGGVHTVDSECPHGGLASVHTVDSGCPQGGHEEEQSKKNKKTFREDPPLSPRGGEAPQAAPDLAPLVEEPWPDHQLQQPQQQALPQQPQPRTAEVSAALIPSHVKVFPGSEGEMFRGAAPAVDSTWPQGPQQGASEPSAMASHAAAVTAPSASHAGHDLNHSGTATPSPKKTRDRFASKTLPADAVPDALLEHQQLLADWWEVKGRGRTEKAFNLACSFLLDQPFTDRRRILEAAVIGGYQGLHPVAKPSGSQQRYDPMENARRATAAIERMEAHAAMAADLSVITDPNAFSPQ